MTFISNGQIILIRPKINLADDGNYREARWFSPWSKGFTVEKFTLNNFTKQKDCLIGVSIIECNGVKFAAEVCEELWVPNSLNIPLYLNDTDIVLNSSGSHFESKKILKRMDLVESATGRSGGAYIYANLIGGDGDRLYFDGGSLIALNGKVIHMEERFRLAYYQVMTRDISLDEIRRNRLKGASIQRQSSEVHNIDVIHIDIDNFVDYTILFDSTKKNKNTFTEKEWGETESIDNYKTKIINGMPINKENNCNSSKVIDNILSKDYFNDKISNKDIKIIKEKFKDYLAHIKYYYDHNQKTLNNEQKKKEI
jgi:hypothetical protein